jgi:hypothetical protein
MISKYFQGGLEFSKAKDPLVYVRKAQPKPISSRSWGTMSLGPPLTTAGILLQ